MLERVADVIEPTLTQTPPNVLRPGLGDLWRLFKLGRAFQKLGTGMGEAVEILTGPARPILDRWFESEQLKATLATDAIIGAFAAPSMPGTAYVLFHHVMGETNGKRGVWGYVKGGMGGLTQALASGRARRWASRSAARPRSRSILVKRRRRRPASRWRTATSSTRPIVASNADANVTFTKLLDPKHAAAGLRRGDRAASTTTAPRSRSTWPCRELPNFTACPGTTPGPQHRGTIHICPDQDYIERAYDDAKYGRPSARPDPGMHDAVGGRSDAWRRRAST